MKQTRRSPVLHSIFFIIAMCLISSGCVEDDEDDESSYPEYIKSSCENIMEHCAASPPWSSYMSTVGQCQSIYKCVYNRYSGSCRSMLKDAFTCSDAITQEYECSRCDDLIAEIPQTCPYPGECMN